MSERTKAAAQAAAKWWTEQVRAPRFDNGAHDGANLLASALAGMLAVSEIPTTDVYAAFERELTARVHAKLMAQERQGSTWVTLGVDYGPDAMLADAAEAAGVPLARFPWKTTMMLGDGYITASAGYAAPHRLIWQSDDWEHPVCGNQGWSNASGDYLPGACSLLRFHEGECDRATPSPLCVDCNRPESYYVHDLTSGRYHGPVQHSFEPSTEVTS